MNTIYDLNNAANVSFNAQSNYTIAFGNSLGNTTRTVDQGFSHAPGRQVPIATLANAVRDVLVDFAVSSTTAVNDIQYTGPYGNIGILKITPTTWRAYGIRDINRYDELFANTQITDAAVSNSYSYTTRVTDQYANTASWGTTVTVLPPPTFSISGNMIYDEGITRPVNVVTVSGNASTTSSYVVEASLNSSVGEVSNATVTGQLVTISGNIANLNSQITGNAILYYPATDLASNVANAIQVRLRRSNDNVVIQTGNITLQIGNTNPEYAITPTGTILEDFGAGVGATITDNDPVNTNYRVRYVQTSPDPTVYATAGRFFSDVANVVRDFARDGDTGYVESTRTEFNRFLPNSNSFFYSPPIDYVGNVTLNYYQDKKVGTAWVNQANAVPVTLTITPHDEYTDPASATSYQEGAIIRLADTAANVMSGQVTDLAYLNKNYTEGQLDPPQWTQTWTQVSPDPAVYPPRWLNGTLANADPATGWSNRGQANITRVGSPSDGVNSIAMRYTPPLNWTGNIVLRFDQTKVQEGNTYTQASNVQWTMNFAGNTTSLAASIASNVLVLNQNSLANVRITDNDTLRERQYSLAIQTQSGGAQFTVLGTSYGNSVTVTGNAAVINAALSSPTSYWVGTLGSANISFGLTRTSPDNTVIANVTRAANITLPAVGQNWRGGQFVGEYDLTGTGNANVLLTLQRGSDVFTPFLTTWASNTVSNTTPTNSARDGQVNTANLAAANSTLFTAATVCDTATLGGFSDWYLPSKEEMRFIGNTVIANPGKFSTVFPGNPTPNKWWTSTIEDFDYGAGPIRSVSMLELTAPANVTMAATGITSANNPVSPKYLVAVRRENA